MASHVGLAVLVVKVVVLGLEESLNLGDSSIIDLDPPFVEVVVDPVRLKSGLSQPCRDRVDTFLAMKY